MGALAIVFSLFLEPFALVRRFFPGAGEGGGISTTAVDSGTVVILPFLGSVLAIGDNRFDFLGELLVMEWTLGRRSSRFGDVGVESMGVLGWREAFHAVVDALRLSIGLAVGDEGVDDSGFFASMVIVEPFDFFLSFSVIVMGEVKISFLTPVTIGDLFGAEFNNAAA